MKFKRVAVVVVVLLITLGSLMLNVTAAPIENNPDTPDTSSSDVSVDEPVDPSQPDVSEPDVPSSEPEPSSEPDPSSDVVSSEPEPPESKPESAASNPAPESSKPESKPQVDNTSKAQSSKPVSSSQAPDEPIYTVSVPSEEENINSQASSSSIQSSIVSSASSEEGMILPEINSADINYPQGIGVTGSTDSSSKDNFYRGIIAWICIGIGIVIVLTVIFGSSYSKSGSRSTYKSSGRKHYKASKNKRRKKRLLSDEYYYNR
ncbi:MAG: hypothetical protein ACI4II_09405 [Acutalibacteraceae bacterium]